MSKSLSNTQTFKYEDIPGFPEATVPGHAGELVFGTIGDVQAVCMRGRLVRIDYTPCTMYGLPSYVVTSHYQTLSIKYPPVHFTYLLLTISLPT
ncbi:hypothetical protein EON63_18200 [archaeon]|nr:MAG: hypothetical protein EON63_18200 [archaeon]